jgi:hypothetical protein
VVLAPPPGVFLLHKVASAFEPMDLDVGEDLPLSLR